jgi:DNA-binding winged helix-turn-helix (wHTH) protein/TolB-like protein
MLNWRSHARPEIRQRGTDAALEIDLAGMPGFSLGSISVEPATLRIVVGSQNKTIEPRVMQVLVALAETSGTVVSRQKLVDICWGGRAVSEDAINRCIAKVRRLGTESAAFEIETIPRVGYRLREAGSEASSTRRIRVSRRSVTIAAMGIVGLAAAVVLLMVAEPGSGTMRPKIAVLPFTSLNSGAEAQQDADSIATGVSGALVQTDAELLTPQQPTADSARKAGASFLISGTVRLDGDSIHVTARIDSAQNGEGLLSRDFNVPSNEPGVAPDRVAAWVADTVDSWSWILRSERDPGRIAALTRIQERKNKYRLLSELAQSAPNSGVVQAAFAGLVPFALSELPMPERRGAILAGRISARRAQGLLPKSGDVYALDCGLYPPGPYVFTSACEDRMQRALELDPGAFFIPFAYAAELTEVGRFHDADALSAKALAAAPFNQDRTALRMQIMWTLPPQYDSQLDLQQREAAARREWPSPSLIDQVRYQMFLNTGAMDKAETMLNDPQLAAMIETDLKGPAHLILRAVRSRRPEAIRAANAACESPNAVGLPPDLVFGTCLTGLAALGDLDGVFRLAERGYEDRLCCSASEIQQKWLASGGQTYPRQYLFGPVMAKVRADRRFIEIARRTGLLAYWKSGHPPDFCSFERAPVCQQLN